MDNNDVAVQEEEWSRKNGWSQPYTYQQFLVWSTIIVFNVIHFVIIVPVLHKSWQAPAYIIPAIVIVGHLICHIIVCSIDPAEDSVRIKKYPKKQFDSNKYQHVIENSYCHICQVEVRPHCKHCRSCNKCIYQFDHHCEYLNNCVGSRNYRWFLGTISTAIVSFTMLLLMSLVEFVAYFTDKTERQILQPYRDLNSSVNYIEADFMMFYQPVAHEAWLTLLGLYFFMGMVWIGMLMHLFVVHMYLVHKNLTMYAFSNLPNKSNNQDDNTDDRINNASSKCIKQNCVSPSVHVSTETDMNKLSLKPRLSLINAGYQKHYERTEAQPQACCSNAQSTTTVPSTLKQVNNNFNNNDSNMNCNVTACNLDLNEDKKIFSTVKDCQKHFDDAVAIEPSYFSTHLNVIRLTSKSLNTNSRMVVESGMEKKDNTNKIINEATTSSIPASGINHT